MSDRCYEQFQMSNFAYRFNATQVRCLNYGYLHRHNPTAITEFFKREKIGHGEYKSRTLLQMVHHKFFAKPIVGDNLQLIFSRIKYLL